MDIIYHSLKDSRKVIGLFAIIWKEKVMSYNSCKNRKVDGLYGKVHFMEITKKGGHPLWRDYQKVKYYARS